jgi:hypothetical protein
MTARAGFPIFASKFPVRRVRRERGQRRNDEEKTGKKINVVEKFSIERRRRGSS